MVGAPCVHISSKSCMSKSIIQPKRPFNGRVIFDHLPKCAGQAVNAWLRANLGSASVTENLIGEHRNLIRSFGGDYPVISGHLHFHEQALDPRY
jgi:hypothetical protein